MKIKPNVNCVIFDLGGVLVNLDWDACVDSFIEIGVESIKDILSTTHQKGLLLDYELGKITTVEYREKIKEISTKPLKDSEIDDALTSLLVNIPEEKLNLIFELKKHYKVFMLSNINEISFEYIKENFFTTGGKQIEDYFDKWYLSYEVGLSKPDARIYQTILDDNNLIAEECLFFDDSPMNVEAARKLGFQAEVIEPYSTINLEF